MSTSTPTKPLKKVITFKSDYERAKREHEKLVHSGDHAGTQPLVEKNVELEPTVQLQKIALATKAELRNAEDYLSHVLSKNSSPTSSKKLASAIPEKKISSPNNSKSEPTVPSTHKSKEPIKEILEPIPAKASAPESLSEDIKKITAKGEARQSILSDREKAPIHDPENSTPTGTIIQDKKRRRPSTISLLSKALKSWTEEIQDSLTPKEPEQTYVESADTRINTIEKAVRPEAVAPGDDFASLVNEVKQNPRESKHINTGALIKKRPQNKTETSWTHVINQKEIDEQLAELGISDSEEKNSDSIKNLEAALTAQEQSLKNEKTQTPTSDKKVSFKALQELEDKTPSTTHDFNLLHQKEELEYKKTEHVIPSSEKNLTDAIAREVAELKLKTPPFAATKTEPESAVQPDDTFVLPTIQPSDTNGAVPRWQTAKVPDISDKSEEASVAAATELASAPETTDNELLEEISKPSPVPTDWSPPQVEPQSIDLIIEGQSTYAKNQIEQLSEIPPLHLEEYPKTEYTDTPTSDVTNLSETEHSQAPSEPLPVIETPAGHYQGIDSIPEVPISNLYTTQEPLQKTDTIEPLDIPQTITPPIESQQFTPILPEETSLDTVAGDYLSENQVSRETTLKPEVVATETSYENSRDVLTSNDSVAEVSSLGDIQQPQVAQQEQVDTQEYETLQTYTDGQSEIYQNDDILEQDPYETINDSQMTTEDFLATTNQNSSVAETTPMSYFKPLLIAVCLIVMAAGISWYLFGTRTEPNYTITRANPPELLQTAQKIPVPLTNDRSQLLRDIETILSEDRGLVQIYPTALSERGREEPASGQTILQFFELRIPGSFSRAVTDLTFGGDTAMEPFIVLRVTQFDTAFAGMLAWENFISTDLAPLFGLPVISTYNPNSRSFDSIQDAYFTDDVVANRSARILYDELGAERIVYSFIDQNTILLTTNRHTLTRVGPLLR